MKKSILLFIFVFIFIFLCSAIMLMGVNPIYTNKLWNFELILYFLIWLFFGIIIHELGHLIFGALTGYRFISFQVGTFLINRGKNKRLRIKKTLSNGLAGQCLMLPPKNKRPFYWYNSGGIIINFFLFVLLFIIIRIVPMNPNLWHFLFVGAVLNLGLGFLNAIPFPGFIQNDGLNMVKYHKNPAILDNVYQNLAIAKQLNEDVTYQELELPERLRNINYRNPFEVFTEIARVRHLFAKGETTEGEKNLKNLYQHRNRILINYRFLIEIIYFVQLSLLKKVDLARQVYERFDPKIKKYLQRENADLGACANILRLILIDYDKKKAIEKIETAFKNTKKSIYYGDSVNTVNMLEQIKKLMKEVESMNIILASKSPRRKDILKTAKIPFRIQTTDHEETFDPSLTPQEAVQQVALHKASEVAKTNPDALVIGADTIVVIDNQILGKPKDESDAIRMLNNLQGRTHQVITGVALIQGGESVTFSETTSVTFEPMTETEISDYIKNEHVSDKAGSYAIQGQAARYINKIDGDFYNVMGLPISKLYKALKKYAQNGE